MAQKTANKKMKFMYLAMRCLELISHLAELGAAARTEAGLAFVLQGIRQVRYARTGSAKVVFPTIPLQQITGLPKLYQTLTFLLEDCFNRFQYKTLTARSNAYSCNGCVASLQSEGTDISNAFLTRRCLDLIHRVAECGAVSSHEHEIAYVLQELSYEVVTSTHSEYHDGLFLDLPLDQMNDLPMLSKQLNALTEAFFELEHMSSGEVAGSAVSRPTELGSRGQPTEQE
jgi:hypothetical protein